LSKLAIQYDRLFDARGEEMGESIALSPNLFILLPAEGRFRRPRKKETLETVCRKCTRPLCSWTMLRSVEELPVHYVECGCGFIVGFRGPALELSQITAAWRSFRRAADRALEQVREN
jgi:hypothetical protein